MVIVPLDGLCLNLSSTVLWSSLTPPPPLSLGGRHCHSGHSPAPTRQCLCSDGALDLLPVFHIQLYHSHWLADQRELSSAIYEPATLGASFHWLIHLLADAWERFLLPHKYTLLPTVCALERSFHQNSVILVLFMYCYSLVFITILNLLLFLYFQF